MKVFEWNMKREIKLELIPKLLRSSSSSTPRRAAAEGLKEKNSSVTTTADKQL